MNLGVRLSALAWMAATFACASVPPANKPALALLPPYVSKALAQNPLAPRLLTAAAEALEASGRYAVKTKGLFDSAFETALAGVSYGRTGILDEGERQAVAASLAVKALGLVDVLNDFEGKAYRVHARIVDAASGVVLESFSATLPWKDESLDVWKTTLAKARAPQAVQASPRLDRTGTWELWWSLAQPLPPEAQPWKAALIASRESGDFDAALRYADLLLDAAPPDADGEWLRRFLTREAGWAREDHDVAGLLAALSRPPGTAAQEALFLVQFIDSVRQTEASGAGSRSEVEAAFHDRFGRDLKVMLTRPALVLVEGGAFRMGSGDGEADERPEHPVTVGSFFMGRTEVTQRQYTSILGTNPSLFSKGSEAPQRPVERVTWYDAVEFCIRLSVADGLEPVYTLQKRSPAKGYPIQSAAVTEDRSKSGYRLPTEAEWEWAARGGLLSRSTLLAGGDDPALVAWTDANAGPDPVALKQPNELGLFDLSGNVWEWCDDWYGKYSSDDQTNPSGPTLGILKVGRGGSWHAAAWNARVTARSYDNPGARGGNLGFRIVRTSPASAD